MHYIQTSEIALMSLKRYKYWFVYHESLIEIDKIRVKKMLSAPVF